MSFIAVQSHWEVEDYMTLSENNIDQVLDTRVGQPTRTNPHRVWTHIIPSSSIGVSGISNLLLYSPPNYIMNVLQIYMHHSIFTPCVHDYWIRNWNSPSRYIMSNKSNAYKIQFIASEILLSMFTRNLCGHVSSDQTWNIIKYTILLADMSEIYRFTNQ